MSTESAVDSTPAGRLRRLTSGDVCDALAELGFANVVVQEAPLVCGGLHTMAGPAVTLELCPSRLPTAERGLVGFLDDGVAEGDVVVIAGHGHLRHVAFGGRAAARAEAQGAAGAVVDGSVRDIDALRDRAFPVFARGTGLYGSDHALQRVRRDDAVVCGGVLIEPGDWIVGDVTGVVAVPRNRLEEVVCLAEERSAVDMETMQELRAGKALRTAHRHFRHERQASGDR